MDTLLLAPRAAGRSPKGRGGGRSRQSVHIISSQTLRNRTTALPPLELLQYLHHFHSRHGSVEPLVARLQPCAFDGLLHRVAGQDAVYHRNTGLQACGADATGDGGSNVIEVGRLSAK